MVIMAGIHVYLVVFGLNKNHRNFTLFKLTVINSHNKTGKILSTQNQGT